MHGPFYQFWTHDQTQFNWLTRVTDKDGDGYGVRFQFLGSFCPKCYSFDQDAVFATGWDETFVRIRPRKGRNILKTDDHFLCVAESLLQALLNAGVSGFEHKPLPGAGWYVLRITNRRRFDPNIYSTEGKPCPVCQRIRQYGSVRFQREIDPPSEELTFFSTDKERGQGGFDIFVTDKLREVLTKSGAKGGELHRLLTEPEEKHEKENPKWRPKGVVISLGQHRETAEW
jgi:hypothetical protein